ncbi:hypothetical protein HDU87_001803 [Geranomyces variabilis]|uniref:N-acetyltransferase domain-containing protein n=1 Tax=Geranomyces variabilis TaxID=109894 RepID=A0AAD5TM86_9FUNG|nr:hypothetical protein HDU87_001803 [Geranomyces variabilis]
MKTTRPIFPAPPGPIIHTERLVLRPTRLSEVDAYHEMRSNAQVMLNSVSGLVDADREATQLFLNKLVNGKNGPTYTFSIYVADKDASADHGGAGGGDDGGGDAPATGERFVGNVGFYDMAKPAVGYMLRREEWGKGYATEALRGALNNYWRLPRHAVDSEDDWPELKRYQTIEQDGSVREGVRAMIEVKNAGSKRVVGKCGFALVEGKEWVPAPDHRGPEKLVWYYLEKPL